MAKNSPWKIGVGGGFILLGIYLAFNQLSIFLTIAGLILIAVGLGVISSY